MSRAAIAILGLMLCSCASLNDRRSSRLSEAMAAVGERYVPAAATSRVPFQVNLETAKPFSSHGIPIADSDVVDREIHWLVRPDDAERLPPWA
ncbi:MAG: hypothetical protein HY718_08125, partial [Planctomycetes bacterium]|nr:hypothetical protein [Planctomycetota bacterium]